jgi:leucyl-tRNA---protein transferase
MLESPMAGAERKRHLMPEGNGITKDEPQEKRGASIQRSKTLSSTVWNTGEALPEMAPQQFYRSTSGPCPYLPGRIERKLIMDLAGPHAARFYNDLSRAGFRRSHHLAYRPACAGCRACVPVRIVVKGFRPSRSVRRIRNANRDISASDIGCQTSIEQYRLFIRYQHVRHGDGDMAAMSFGDYRAMVEYTAVNTHLLEFRDGSSRLVGACLIDRLDDGFSAVYSFFDPDAGDRSLGSHIILQLIENARAEGLPYVYLGYWIAESEKMAYKSRFRPLEGLGERGWQPLLQP